MSKKIIGLVGETGSGKDTFCKIIKELSPPTSLIRFSEVLTQTLGLFFDEIKKEDQQWLANVLRDRFGEDILMKAVSKKIKDAKNELIVVNGMRVKEEFDFIKKEGGVVIYITLDAKKRWERIKERGEKKDDNGSYEKFLEIDNGRTEKQIKEIGKMADFVIENNKDLNYLENEIKKIIEKI
jgi:dephospho-CoA kinase